jgi:hypothetical protein
MNYEFHPEAEIELLDAAAHYEAEVPGLGERFADEVEPVAHGSRGPAYWASLLDC